MRPRLNHVVMAVLTLAGCTDRVSPTGFQPPPFPPELSTEVTTESGLLFRADGEILSTGPTTLRVTATIENPSGEDLDIPTLADECELIVVVSWESSPFLRIVDPPDGGGRGGGALGACGTRTATRTIAAGETVELVSDDIVLSEFLRSTFVPGGRYVISAIYVDSFIFEVLALDAEIQD